MTRLCSSLLLFAVAALLTTGAPVLAGPEEPVKVAAAAADPATWLDAEVCPATPVTSPTVLELVAPPNGDFILCTCQFCKYHPDTDCQISPKGYSILCADWYRRHC